MIYEKGGKQTYKGYGEEAKSAFSPNPLTKYDLNHNILNNK